MSYLPRHPDDRRQVDETLLHPGRLQQHQRRRHQQLSVRIEPHTWREDVDPIAYYSQSLGDVRKSGATTTTTAPDIRLKLAAAPAVWACVVIMILAVSTGILQVRVALL